MGIKSLTVVSDDDGKDVCVLSRDMDGDLTGHGAYLRKFLRGFIIARRSRPADQRSTVPSMGRLAAILIAEFRSGIGEFELLPSATRGVDEDYVYTIYPRHSTPSTPSLLNLRVEAAFASHRGSSQGTDTMTVLYDGLLDEFEPCGVLDHWSCTSDEFESRLDAHITTVRATATG